MRVLTLGEFVHLDVSQCQLHGLLCTGQGRAYCLTLQTIVNSMNEHMKSGRFFPLHNIFAAQGRQRISAAVLKRGACICDNREFKHQT